MKKTTILIALLIFVGANLNAQLSESWKGKAGSPIIWQKLSPEGSLIVGTKDGKTVALDQESGETLWSQNFEKGTFKTLPNTTYIYWASEDNDIVVVDPVDGKIVCDSKALGVSQIATFYPVRVGNAILLYSTMNSLEQLTMVNLNDGAKLWQREFNFNKKVGSGMFSVELQEDTAVMELHCAPIGDGKGGVFVSFHERIMNIDGEGTTLWDIEFPSQFGDQSGFFKSSGVDFKNIIPDQTGEFLYVFSGAYMSCHKRADGSLAWENPVKVFAPVKNIIFEKEHMTLIPTPNTASQKAYINCVDYNTGTTKFGEQELRVKGGFVQSAFCSKGIVMITKAFMSGATYFNIINQETGKFELEKPLKIFAGPYQVEEVDKGIIITSSHGAQLYDYATKEFTVNKELKVSGDGTLIRQDVANKIYLYSTTKNNIFMVNKEDMSMTQFNKAKINLEGKDTPKGFTVVEDGIILFADQNIIKFNWEGNVVFQKYYKAPGASGWQIVGASFEAIGGLAQMATAAATATVYQNMDDNMGSAMTTLDAAAANQAASGELSQQDYADYKKDSEDLQQAMDLARDEVNNEMAECAALGFSNTLEASAEIGRLSKRFKNSKATKDNVVMMINDKEQGGIGLAVVSKKDGEVKLFIPMKQSREDTKYEIDPISNRLFWIPNMSSSNNSHKYSDVAGMEKEGAVLMFDMSKL